MSSNEKNILPDELREELINYINAHYIPLETRSGFGYDGTDQDVPADMMRAVILGPLPSSISKEDADYINNTFVEDCQFQEQLYKIEREKGITGQAVYGDLEISKGAYYQLFKPGYHPQKGTVLMLCIKYQLSIDEAKEFLKSAGYILDIHILEDVVVMCCLQFNHDIHTANCMLYDLKCRLLKDIRK